MTFEASLGLGSQRFSHNAESNGSDPGGAFAGVGGWVNDRMAITGRISSVSIFRRNQYDDDVRFTLAFVVGSLQYWIGDSLWASR